MDDADRLNYATPTLMRAARGAYAQSIRAQLHAIGVDDLPRNGAFILAGIDPTGGPRQDLPTGLGVSKQAVSQVIEALVNRGYLTRSPDPSDRRRISLELTGRGQQVVDAVLAAVEDVDRRLLAQVSAEQVEAMRAGAGHAGRDQGHRAGDRRRAAPAARASSASFSPIFPVRDLAAALDHYTSLGFDTLAYAGGADYGFANRDGTGLHLAAHPDHEAAPAQRRDIPVRPGRRRAVRGVEPARHRRRDPAGRPDRVPAARGVAHRPGREPDPLRLTGRRRVTGWLRPRPARRGKLACWW